MAFGWDISDNVIVAHAVLGGLLGLIIWPTMALSARYLRAYPKWTRIHYSIGWALAVPILIVVFGLGTWHVKPGAHDAWSTLHFRLGLVLLLLGILQPIYGTLLHNLGSALPRTGVRSLTRWFHPISGIVTLALGWLQVYSGFDQWSGPGSRVPRGLVIAWGVLVALWGLLYLGGLGLVPRQLRLDKAEKARASGRTTYSP